MFDLASVIVGFIACWIFRTFYEAYKSYRMWTRLVAKINADMARKEKEDAMPVSLCYVQEDDNGVFLYDATDNKFLCQGLDYEDLAKNLYDLHKIERAVVLNLQKENMLFEHGIVK